MSDQIQKREAGVQTTLEVSPKTTSKQLLYRPASVGKAVKPMIRSVKTAALLQLERNNDAHGLLDEGAMSVPRRRTVQPGGFIRSRMTAELLGIEPSGPIS